jgi:hypothetical protein
MARSWNRTTQSLLFPPWWLGSYLLAAPQIGARDAPPGKSSQGQNSAARKCRALPRILPSSKSAP